MDVKYYDKHTLYILTGIATAEQIDTSFRQTMREVEGKLGRRFPCQYQINLVCDKHEKSLEFAYLWISNEEIYHILLGRNPDGSLRQELIFHSNEEGVDSNGHDNNSNNSNGHDNNKSWSEMVEEEDMSLKYRDLPPLITLANFPYTAQQIKEHGLTEESGAFIVSPAYVFPLEDYKCPHTLVSQKIPSWVNEKIIKSIFSKFASDNKRQVTRRFGKEMVTDTYPIVRIAKFTAGYRSVYVHFDPATRDAQFALLMNKKTIMTNSTTGRKQIIFFIHDHNSDQS